MAVRRHVEIRESCRRSKLIAGGNPAAAQTDRMLKLRTTMPILANRVATDAIPDGVRIETERDYFAAINRAVELKDAPPSSADAERLAETIQAIEEYEVRHGWQIHDDMRISTIIVRYRSMRGIE